MLLLGTMKSTKVQNPRRIERIKPVMRGYWQRQTSIAIARVYDVSCILCNTVSI